MQIGIVKIFNQEKGFGFIKHDVYGEIYVHSFGLIDQIKENDRVQFELERGRKGVVAVKVEVIR